MSVTIRPIRVSHPTFAGEVRGIDLTQPISRSDAAAIEAGMDADAEDRAWSSWLRSTHSGSGGCQWRTKAPGDQRTVGIPSGLGSAPNE